MAWASQIEAWNDGATLPTGRQCRHPLRRFPLTSACQLLANPDEAAVDSNDFMHQRVEEQFGRVFVDFCCSGVRKSWERAEFWHDYAAQPAASGCAQDCARLREGEHPADPSGAAMTRRAD